MGAYSNNIIVKVLSHSLTLSLSLSLSLSLKSVSMHSEGETTSKVWSKRVKIKMRGERELSAYRYIHTLCTLEGFTVMVTISSQQVHVTHSSTITSNSGLFEGASHLFSS